MGMKKFESEYKRLNPNQKKAVDTVEGTVMVVAGPGTGKTQILSLRIANILRKTDTEPENILALTFTNAGVFSMRKRLVEIIGAEAYRVNIFTFHSFCEVLVNEYGEEFDLPKADGQSRNISGAKLISPVEQLQIIEKIIEEGEFKKLRPWGDASHYINSLPAVLSELKREAVSVEKLNEVLAKQEREFSQIEDLYHAKGKWKGQMKGKYKLEEKNLEKNKEVVVFYEEYEKRMRMGKLYDYDDVILETITAMENNSDFLLTLQEKYQYILVDEHQDTNNAQNRILELLTNFFERPNLFIVGDEKQAIYRFQGASLENFMFFKDKYQDVLIVNLLENYRSTQKILDSALSLMGNSQELGGFGEVLGLKAIAGGVGREILVYPFSEKEFEMRFLVTDIQKKIKAGTKMNEIAVFYRNNDEVLEISRGLEKAGVSFVVESKQDILADTDILKIVLLIKAVNGLGNDALLGELLFVDFLEIDSLDIYKLMSACQKEKLGLFDCLSSEKLLEKIGVNDKEKLGELYKKIEGWKKTAMNKDLVTCLEEIIYQSGYFDYLLKLEDSADKLHKLNKLFDEAKRFVQEKPNLKLSDFIKYLGLLENYKLSIKTKSNDLFEGVRLMTAHSAKGLEFDVVYIVNAVDKHWGNKVSRNKFKLPINKIEQDNADERRLFFVALTRARQEVVITYAKKKRDGRDLMPAQFLTEIDERFIKEIAVKDLERDFMKKIEVGGGVIKRKKASLKNKEYLNRLFLQRGLNATAVNNYLQCPWNYFFKSLLKIPMAYNKNMAYGNVVHKTLEEFFENVRQGRKTSKKMLLDIFRKNAEKGFLNDGDKQEALAKGEGALAGCYDTYHGEWKKEILNEFNIKGILFEIETGREVFLSGKLDKVELLEDGQVKVIDYKTGKIRTRGVIEGKTQASNGDYKRQLVFYKLLLDRYNDGRYKMIEGEINFIEPNEKGQYQKEVFEISEVEVQALGEVIKRVSQEILNLAFWNKRCNDQDCEFCRLREVMK